MSERIIPENPLSTGDDGTASTMAPPEVVTVTRWKVACDGNDAAGLGHPRVWLAISPITGFVDCGYCDKRFVIDRDNAHDDH